MNIQFGKVHADKMGQYIVLPDGVNVFSETDIKNGFWVVKAQDGAIALLPRKARQSRRLAKKFWKLMSLK